MNAGKCKRFNDRLADNGKVRYLHYVAKRLRPWRILKYSIHEEKPDGRSSFNEENNFRKCIRMSNKQTIPWKRNYLTNCWKH